MKKNRVVGKSSSKKVGTWSLNKKLALLFMMMLIALSSTQNSYAQKESFNLKLDNVSVKQAFQEIEKKSDYIFIYSDQVVDLNRKISVNVQNGDIDAILKQIFKGTSNTYKVNKRQITILIKSKDQTGNNNTSSQELTKKKTIQGSVKDENGDPLPGVNVLIKGTLSGTITNFDGNYTISVEEGQTLSYSFMGYLSEEVLVKELTTINISLVPDAKVLDAVVVTALSIARDKSSLGYSITQVDSEELTSVKQSNPINSLAGKVAGLQITSAPTGIDGSARVVIRGISSLSGGNRPLLVIDGIPSSGGTYGGAGVGGGYDRGDELSDLNPDDIESMSVLKGAGAAAIYGSRGANGVILITTKKGKNAKGLGVSFNSSVMFDTPMLLPDLQDEYGQGAFGRYPTEIKGSMDDIVGEEPWIWSWGSKMDGSLKEDWLGNMVAYEAQPNRYKEFYRTGYNIINTLAFDNRGKKTTYRASITLQNGQGMYPTNDLKKQTFNIHTSTKFSKLIELDTKVTYIHNKANNRPYLGEDPANAGWSLGALPRNVVLQTVKDHSEDANGYERWAWDRTVSNPYWTMDNKRNSDEKHRVQALASLKLNFTEKLNLLIRSGIDLVNRKNKEYAAMGSLLANAYGGFMRQAVDFGNYEWNNDFFLSYKNSINKDFDYSLNLGGSHRSNVWGGVSQYGGNWKVPDFYHISNATDFSTGEWTGETEVLSLYGLGTLSFRDYLYLDLTYRNDWSSTLPIDNNRYTFYSNNVSFLFSDAFNLESDIFSKGKIRASIAQVGNDAGAYQTMNYYNVWQSNYPFPIGGMSGQLAFEDFKPEITNSWEVGTELSFFKNRLGIDLTYYDGVTKNQIMDVQLAPSTGFSSRKINAGEVRNYGYEALITGSIIAHKALNWDMSLNMSKNINRVVSLSEGVDRRILAEAVSGLAFVEMRTGEPYGSIYGYDYAYNENGEKLINDSGDAIRGEYKKLGDINPDLTGGLSNSLSYKNWNINFLIDFQLGGEYYSQSKLYHDLFGTSKRSLEGRDEWYSTHQGPTHGDPIPGVVPKGYVEDGVNVNTGEPNDVPIQPMYRNVNITMYQRIVSDYIIDATNVRLRELSLGYTLPKKWMDKSPFTKVDVSFIARNLFFFYNADGDYDPESGLNSGSIGNAFQMNPMPSARSYGFNIAVNF